MPVKYIPYNPDTIAGQALLNNVQRNQRLLTYRESNKVFDRIDRGLPFYETEVLEVVQPKTADPNTMPKNLVIRGECLSACAYLAANNITVDLVYIDPPFASGADYAKKIYLRKNPKLAQKIAEAEQQLDIETIKAFEETMYGDIWNKADYLNWMFENLMAIKNIMSDTASIYVHLDWHIGHYVKILMDEVFGEDNFVNEIIWSYRSGGASKKSSIARKHDSIYFYTNNSNNFEINTVYERQYLEKDFMGSSIDENGKFYVDTILTDSLTGLIHRVMPDGKVQDYSVRPVLNVSKERVDYSTQKPEGLLGLLIEVASKPDMLVADFFGGSGVTAKVAHDLGRRFVHCDIGINSIQTVRDRLVAAKASFSVLEVQDGLNLFRNPIQTMNKLAQLIPGLQQNKVEGISKFWFGTLGSTKKGIVPVYVPDLINSQHKILDIPAINHIVNTEFQNLPDNISKVVVYYVDIENQSELEKFVANNNATQISIEYRDLKNLMHNVVIADVLQHTLSQTNAGFCINIDSLYSDRIEQKINAFNQKGNLQSIKTNKTFTPIDISAEGLELVELIALDCINTEGVWHTTTETKIDKLGYVSIDGTKSKLFWDGTISSTEAPKRLKVRNICGDETIVVL